MWYAIPYSVSPSSKNSDSLIRFFIADSLACNFDMGTFCSWKNIQQDDFDWQIGKSTPTLTTGPSEDHTTRKGTSEAETVADKKFLDFHNSFWTFLRKVLPVKI